MKTNKAKTPAEIKQIIIQRFNDRVRGRRPDIGGFNVDHDGSGGHWLEQQMGVAHNASNSPDIMGFEMKNDTSSKTTFGDWSASYYIFNDRNYGSDRDKFMEIFGSNSARADRYSWSGRPTPKIGAFNDFGQILVIEENNDILAIYSFTADRRPNKAAIVPPTMQKDGLLIAKWDAANMKKKVEDKFNKLGWFKCLKDYRGAYYKIVFGGPINFNSWIEGVKKGFIFFDSGMFQGNSRNYSQWRADNRYWESLVTDTH